MGNVLPLSSKSEGDWYDAIRKEQSDGVELDEKDREKFNRAFEHYIAGSFNQANKEFSELARKGSSISQYFLGVMCYKGMGALQDFSRAHMWFNIAASQGHDKARRHLERLTRKLSSDQIADAQKMARKWVHKHLQG